VKAAPSKLQVKVDPPIVDVKLKLAEVLDTEPVGPAVIVVSGGAITVQVRLVGVASIFPAVSVARTWKVCDPLARPV
jgi:hypothetical protein